MRGWFTLREGRYSTMGHGEFCFRSPAKSALTMHLMTWWCDTETRVFLLSKFRWKMHVFVTFGSISKHYKGSWGHVQSLQCLQCHLNFFRRSEFVVPPVPPVPTCAQFSRGKLLDIPLVPPVPKTYERFWKRKSHVPPTRRKFSVGSVKLTVASVKLTLPRLLYTIVYVISNRVATHVQAGTILENRKRYEPPRR